MDLSANTQQMLVVIATVLSVLNSVLQAINHKRLVSTCCSRKMEFGLDIKDAEPSPIRIAVNNNASVGKAKHASVPDVESLPV